MNESQILADVKVILSVFIANRKSLSNDVKKITVSQLSKETVFVFNIFKFTLATLVALSMVFFNEINLLLCVLLAFVLTFLVGLIASFVPMSKMIVNPSISHLENTIDGSDNFFKVAEELKEKYSLESLTATKIYLESFSQQVKSRTTNMVSVTKSISSIFMAFGFSNIVVLAIQNKGFVNQQIGLILFGFLLLEVLTVIFSGGIDDTTNEIKILEYVIETKKQKDQNK